MKIQLDDKWAIEADTRCWILSYESADGKLNPKTGLPGISKDQTFHANLEQALKYYLNESAKEATALTEIITCISRSEHNIEMACMGIGKDA